MAVRVSTGAVGEASGWEHVRYFFVVGGRGGCIAAYITLSCWDEEVVG